LQIAIALSLAPSGTLRERKGRTDDQTALLFAISSHKIYNKICIIYYFYFEQLIQLNQPIKMILQY